MYALEIKNLKKTYSNKVHALRGIDLKVAKGDFFALLGHNGAGKSTMIGIITSLVNKTSGSVMVCEQDIDKNSEKAKAFIGVVPQEFNCSIFENIMQITMNQAGYYGIDRKTAYKNSEKYLKLLGLWNKRNDIAYNLSGGMKRRLMIARALIHEPEVLLLDEPTAGVDIENRHSMWKFLQDINKAGKTIVLTTHYLEEAENLCENVAIIKDGKIVKNDSIKNVLNKLESQTFVIDTESPCDLKKISFPKGVAAKQLVDTKLEVMAAKKVTVNQMLEVFIDSGVVIKNIQPKSSRLEEFFVNMTKEKKS